MRRRKSERKDVVQGDPGNWVRFFIRTKLFEFGSGEKVSRVSDECFRRKCRPRRIVGEYV